MISSGLKLTKVLTAMLAIQVYMHKRDTSEVRIKTQNNTPSIRQAAAQTLQGPIENRVGAEWAPMYRLRKRHDWQIALR